MIARLLAALLWRNPPAARPAGRVSQSSTSDTGADAGSNRVLQAERLTRSSSPASAGAQPDPVKLYADRLAAFRRVPHGAGRRAALSEALHDKLKAEMGR